MADAIIIGGGVYGVAIATYLAEIRKLQRIILLEQSDRLMGRASFNNQARIHGGYHYPRSFTTAYRSRHNMARFISEYSGAIDTNFTHLYAIAKRNSKITSAQMARFCSEIGAPLTIAPPPLNKLFDRSLIDCAYIVDEPVFNADALADIALNRLRAAGVEVRFATEATGLASNGDYTRVPIREGENVSELTASMVFNCTYSRLQRVAGPGAPRFGLRHEMTEMLLVEMPPALSQLGITVMDGPFFSVMPFPSRQLHSFSHVRYTPHDSWNDDDAIDPYAYFEAHPKQTRADWIVRDAARYVPLLSEVIVKSSLFEVKTVLTRTDNNDGRPMMFARHGEGERLFSVLGGKIDNVYDLFERLDLERLPTLQRA